MKRNNKVIGILMAAGGVLMVFSAALIMASSFFIEDPSVCVSIHDIVPWIFLPATVVYVVMQRMLNTKTDSFILRRLYAIQLLSGVCFIVAALLLIEQYNGFLLPLVVNEMNSYYNYLRFVHNNWVVMMLVGALLQLYSTHRISNEVR